MRLHILTLNPQLHRAFFAQGMFARAQERKVFTQNIIDIRPYGLGKYKQVDDTPYGGGSGMLLRADVLANCIRGENVVGYTVLPSPRGKVLTQSIVQKLAQKQSICLICPKYEGVDQRFINSYVDEEISLGDYVINSGDIAALVLIEAVIRIHPNFMNNPESVRTESFEQNLLESDQYTKPAVWESIPVPPALQSGHHQNILKWTQNQALWETFLRRRDLFARQTLSREQIAALWELYFMRG